jgi:hypothetical protein
MKNTTFGEHGAYQVQTGVPKKAREMLVSGDAIGVFRTAFQYAYNMGVYGIYKNLTKEQTYDTLKKLRDMVFTTPTLDRASDICDEMDRIAASLNAASLNAASS